MVMQSMLVAVRRHMELHRAGAAVACLLLAMILLLAARLVDIPPIPHWTDSGNDAGPDISPPLVAIAIGGVALVGCTLALAVVRRRVWCILAACVFFLACIAAICWLSLATLGDALGTILPRAYTYTPTNRLNDAAQLPLHGGGLALLLLATVAVGHLIQAAWHRTPVLGEGGLPT